MRKLILVTGGTGMVGRNVLEHRHMRRYEVIAPTRRELDLLDGAAVEQFIREAKPDLIIHSAGRVGGIQANMNSPVEFLVENTEIGTHVILGAARSKVPRLLNLGTSCMFPRGHDEPMAEELVLTGELEPTNEGYALAKIVAARLCRYVNRQYGLSYKTLIPCNLYGRYDNFDPDTSHLVPAVLRKLHEAKKRGDRQVEIWGTGEARREFLYVGDLADLIARAVERFDGLPEMLNVGIGRDYAVNDYYRIGAEVVGFDGTFEHDLSKPVGMQRKLVSVERLKQFGWSAPTDLRTGLRKTYDFFLEKFGG